MGEAIKFGRGLLKVLNPVFSENSWEDIIAACQSGKVLDTWAVGDQKTMKINGADYAIDIIGKNHDTYAAGGTAPLTFQMHDCYGTMYSMNGSDTTSGGWTSCRMRSTHLPAILALMPSEVQAGIKEVNKLTSEGSGSSTINTSADKLFLLSEIEVCGSITWSTSGEGTQYAYYANGGSKQKTYNSSAKEWWLRSPYATTHFCYVTFSGTSNALAASGSWGNCSTSFAFCF